MCRFSFEFRLQTTGRVSCPFLDKIEHYAHSFSRLEVNASTLLTFIVVHITNKARQGIYYKPT